MKPLILIIFSFIAIKCFGQPNAISHKVFKITDYNIGGSISRETLDTIPIDTQKINLAFYKLYFSIPHNLPKSFTDTSHKNVTITVWRDINEVEDMKDNWNYKYTYDSLSRLIRYSYSGCFICSNQAYCYNVTYNSYGQVAKISDIVGEHDIYQIQYNIKGDVVQLDYLKSGNLEKQIKLLK